VAFFSGFAFEATFAGLIMLPPGWSVEWDGSSAGADTDPKA